VQAHCALRQQPEQQQVQQAMTADASARNDPDDEFSSLEEGADLEHAPPDRHRRQKSKSSSDVAIVAETAERDPAMTEMQRIVAALSEQLSQQSELLTKQSAELAGMQAKLAALHEPEKEDSDGKVVDRPQTLYAYCIHKLAEPALGVVETARLLLMLFTLVFGQFVFMFAFCDAHWVTSEAAQWPAFKDPVELHNFYQSKTIIINNTPVPVVNVLASLVAIVLLACGPLRDDNLQTMTAPQPIDSLLFRKAGSTVHSHTWLKELLLVLPLQLTWVCRAVLLPTLAVVGTATGLACANSAVDIVLNSVAVGFIFEIDDAMYTVLLDEQSRLAYERAPPEAGTYLAVPSAALICSRYSWALVFIDVPHMLLVFATYAWSTPWDTGAIGTIQPFTVYWQVFAFVLLRGATYAMMGTHLALRLRWHKFKLRASRISVAMKRSVSRNGLSWQGGASVSAAQSFELGPQLWDVCRLIISAGSTMACVVFTHKVYFQGLTNAIGASTYCIQLDSQLHTCLHSYAKSAECVQGVLNSSLAGDELVMSYSYADAFWSGRDWGPSTVGCSAPRDVA